MPWSEVVEEAASAALRFAWASPPLQPGARQDAVVAGGMNKKGAPLPAWLVAANAEARLAAEEAMRQRRPDRKIHVWVRGSAGDWPGLVLDWRREGAGWAALAVWTKGDGDFVSAWVDAESVSPVETDAEAG